MSRVCVCVCARARARVCVRAYVLSGRRVRSNLSEPLVVGNMGRPADFGLVDLDAIATAALQPVIEDLGVGVDKVRPAVVLQDLQPLQRLLYE